MSTELPERFYRFLTLLKRLEGGVVNNKNDNGGLTNLGVTQVTYNTFRKDRKLPIQSVTKITEEEVASIFYVNYYNHVNFIEEEYPHYLMFDLAVNSGPGKAKQCVQEVDNPHDAANILTWRRQYYNRLVACNPTQKGFLKGWMNRLTLIQKNYEVVND